MKRIAGVLTFAIAALACGQTRETRSVSDLTRFQACRIEIDENSTKQAYRDIVTDQIETSLTGQGICDVQPSGNLILRLRPRVRAMGIQTETGGPHAEATMEVTVVDGATGKDVGAFSTKVDTLDEAAQAMHGKNDEKALRRASEEVVNFVRSKRGSGRNIAKRNPSAKWSPAPDTGAVATAAPQATATPAATAPQAGMPPPKGCSLQCIVPHHGAISAQDEARLTSEMGAVMSELHACAGGDRGGAIFTLRFNSQSKLASMGIDVGDHEGDERPCMETVRSRTPFATMPGPVTVRCTERCGR